MLLLALPAAAHPQADRIFTGGFVYTLNPDQPWAEAVAIREGRIAYVGDAAGATGLAGPATEVVDLAGALLLPGFHDSHAHLMAAGTRFLRCQFKGLDWPGAVLARIAECARALPDGEWLRGVDLDPAMLESGAARRELLDGITAGHPAMIATPQTRSVWVNSAALQRAGIDAASPDPAHGRIERDLVSGEPTGILHGEALGGVWALASQYSHDQYREALRQASALANRYGITTSSEAAASEAHFTAYRAADAAGEMTVRVSASLRWDPDYGVEKAQQYQRLAATATGPRFRVRWVKLFLDGGSLNTLSMLEPFADPAGDTGLSHYGDGLTDLVGQLDRAGLDVHFHAYGDRAVREALDAVAAASVNQPHRARRPHLSHLALVAAEDLPRFAALGVTADVQPLWAYWNADHQEGAHAMGVRRTARLVPIASLFASGARVVAGSDWISESMNPLVGIQYAVTRRPLDGSGPPWNPHERATLEQMLAAYTVNGAWLAGQEDLTGTVEVGKAADLVVLEDNLFDIDPMTIHRVRVLLTLLEGEEVYRAGGWPGAAGTQPP